ncbi:cell division protein FtsX [Cricetibacter osteomyelitidis]|uniref:Cell division protein FtsX n=1 Tax=Cricetibacter osteomyelitidis TaxID=1521931 RepID=A0A4R2TQE9_9PAST|nr:permease-like cell division protein FtsX [Cricetibacter osteomyelitidis]TCP97242.1 cell division protein FtsX [Cricetibacter osteomyelitidis]
MARQINASIFVQTAYVFRSVWADLMNKKIGTFLTILAITVSLTIPVTTFLLWKNSHLAATQFYPESELTVYLHKNLSEKDANAVVDKIRNQEGIESLNYISRQESLNEFRAWSGFGEELDILDDNPLPAVVTIKTTQEYNESSKRSDLVTGLNKIKGVQEVRQDNECMEKLTALTWLIAHVAIVSTVLMAIAVCLVIGNSIRSDVYGSRAQIEVSKLLGATEQFVLRPFLLIGVIYGFFGALFACILSGLLLAYFDSAVQYVTDIFAVKFELNGLQFSEILFLLVICSVIGYASAWISASRHINQK